MPHPNPRTLTYLGESLTIPAWSRRLGIPESTIRSRIDHLGMTVEEALARPVERKFRPTPKAQRVIVRPPPPLQEDDRGRAVVRWSQGGRERKKVFGQPGREASAAYARWCAEWYACQGQPAPEKGESLSVAGLVLRCLDWAAETFRKRGKITSEVYGYRAALGSLNDLYGDTDAATFTPTQFRALIGQWVKQGLSLTTCNNYRSKIIPRLHSDPERQAVLEAIVRLQRATGMRPSEVLSMRIDDLDCSREPWVYRPADGGKTLHHDKARRAYLGPRARAILAPLISASKPGQPLFRMRHQRKDKEIGVSVVFYRDCLASACRLAGVPTIRPNQIRHTKATEIHDRYENDSKVAAALGNTAEVARQVYVDDAEQAVARRIAEELG